MFVLILLNLLMLLFDLKALEISKGKYYKVLNVPDADDLLGIVCKWRTFLGLMVTIPICLI
uniref:Uncharacterized protein n=1 Tax=Rhizophora mucronata TaxID=61149 RepID=A0A2P2N683_RHIMU